MGCGRGDGLLGVKAGLETNVPLDSLSRKKPRLALHTSKAELKLRIASGGVAGELAREVGREGGRRQHSASAAQRALQHVAEAPG